MKASLTINNGIITASATAADTLIITIDGLDERFDNAFVLPGFTDHHGHIAALGKKITGVPLSNCQSAGECIELLKATARPRGRWIVEYGWNNEHFPDTFYPAKELLDEAFPENPVYLVRIDGHSAWVNTKALIIAGIDKFTPDPFGGIIEKGKSGEPTGILIDNAMNLVANLIPPYNETELEGMISMGIKELASKGITTACDMDVDNQSAEIYRAMAGSGKLPLNVNLFLKAQHNEWIGNIPHPFVKGKLNICGLKFFADGALGSRGAALMKPYKDFPSSKGLLLIKLEEIFDKAKVGIENGWQIAVHAIGDAANRMVINVYERLRREKVAGDKDILRIEHAQIISPHDINRFTENNIIASVQPVHCISDVPMAAKRLNADTLANSYRWKSLMDAGVTILGGSDFPIESHDPLLGIDAFVNRVPDGSDKPWEPKERLTVEEAMNCYASSTSNERLKTGDRADFIIIDTDLMKIDSKGIKNAKVIATYCNGKKIYGRKA